MKRFSLMVLVLLFAWKSFGQLASGKVTVFIINAKTLQNSGGENPNRKVSVYLPPGYEKGNKRFPVIYYMHGFMGTDSISSTMKMILDRSIARQNPSFHFSDCQSIYII